MRLRVHNTGPIAQFQNRRDLQQTSMSITRAPTQILDAPAPSRDSWPFPLWSIIIFLTIYPLSVGPVAMALRNKAVPKPVELFYKPLEMLYNNSDPAKQFFNWYIDLWTQRNRSA
jgi:hypothetical protein